MNSDILTDNVDKTFEIIKTLIIDTKERVYSTVNTEMVMLYWNIGRYIMEMQNGNGI